MNEAILTSLDDGVSYQTNACESHFAILVAGRQTSKFQEMVRYISTAPMPQNYF
jgi:hypothetical protein